MANIKILAFKITDISKFDDEKFLRLLNNSYIQKLEKLGVPKLTAKGIKTLKDTKCFAYHLTWKSLINRSGSRIF